MRVRKKSEAIQPQTPFLSATALSDESESLAHVAGALNRLLVIYQEALADATQIATDIHPAAAEVIVNKAGYYLNYVVEIQRFTQNFVYQAHQRCLEDRTK